MSEVARNLENLPIPKTKAKHKPYPAYRDSGIEWLGSVPEEWEVKRFKFAVQISKNKGDGNDLDMPYLGLENIESWTGKLIELETKIEPESNVNIFDRNEVLFGKLRPYLAKVYLAEQPGICSTELLVVRENQIIAHFLKYLFLSHNFINVVNSLTYGVKMPRASWELIGNLYSVVPPTSDQQTIANFLDKKTAQIDALMEKKQRLIELLKEKRTALISHAVTKGLDPNVKMKDSGVEWLGEVPEGWDAQRLKFLSRIQTGSTPPKSIEEYYDINGTPWIKPDDLEKNEYIIESKEYLTDTGAQVARLVPELSSLVCCIGTVGKLGLAGKALTTNQQINAVIFNDKIQPKFGFYALKSSESEHNRLSNKNVVQILNADNQKQIFLPCPAISEQQSISNFLDKKTAQIDALIEKVRTAIDKLKEYRTALISAAVTGKIDVRGLRKDVPNEI
ncbi:MAG: type I restriction endonuclease subunit S [Deltaproteobacteria bacterium CG11_big_fil_rev_8_21_14_0_20_49_13]|nr:MAG: type I restriction endonuclease subunit S [Deltaproteobacteria bacterium CG11_big_fil_rev_8_21_14_0_20_49_13]